MIVQILFWFFLLSIFYCYFGYTLVLWFLSLFVAKSNNFQFQGELPDVTLLIAAYNEKDILNQKIENIITLNYPNDKLHVLWVTDGSDDGTPEIVRQQKNMTVLHEPARSGKTAAINRAMQFVNSPFVVFSDANTMLSPDAINEIVSCFTNPKVGSVAGEKKIQKFNEDKAVSSGEGFYWKYESYIKKLESQVNSTVGAAGELFAIRTELFKPISEDIILDDFVISIAVADKGYKIMYAPLAQSVELSSESISEELKRKIRIAAGAMQVLIRKPGLLNPFHYGFLSFQYFSHKVLRWVLVPFAFIAIFIINAWIVFYSVSPVFYSFSFIVQVMGYLAVLVGYFLKDKPIKMKAVFLPYYVATMNYAIIAGIIKFFCKDQQAAWDKAKRRRA